MWFYILLNYLMQVDSARAILLLKQGGVVAIPTETVYGLAADATNDRALRQIYAIKKRPANNPLIVHIAAENQVLDWAAEFPPLAQKLAQAFWPGPLTLVLPAKPHISNILRANQPTIALRVPNHANTLKLLQDSGLALAAPSANTHTQLSPTTVAHVTADLGEGVPVLDGGPCKVGIESTIVSVQGNDWRMLRLGMLTEAEIKAVALRPAQKNDKPLPKSPGQQLLHYSPKTTVELFNSRDDLLEAVAAHKNCVVLMVGEGVALNRKTFNLPSNPDEAAERLYDMLHKMDAIKADVLFIESPPREQAWLAINDRLKRAAYKGS